LIHFPVERPKVDPAHEGGRYQMHVDKPQAFPHEALVLNESDHLIVFSHDY
jgi:hypothetical protein